MFTKPTGIFINPTTCASTIAGTSRRRQQIKVPSHRPTSLLLLSADARNVEGILSSDRFNVFHHLGIKFGKVPAPIDLEPSRGIKMEKIGVDTVDTLAHQAAHL